MGWLVRINHEHEEHDYERRREREAKEAFDHFAPDYEDAVEWLEEKPETWRPYESKPDGKREVMEMEIAEFGRAVSKARSGDLTPEEMKVAVEHVIASALAYHCHLRKMKRK